MSIPQSPKTMPLVALAALCLATLASGCSEDKPCSTNEAFRNGYCYPTDAAAKADAGSASSADGATGFGQTCAVTADCPPPTSYCIPTLFYCSALGCDVDPTVCPAGWTCMDVSAWGLAEHMCLQL